MMGVAVLAFGFPPGTVLSNSLQEALAGLGGDSDTRTVARVR